MKLKCDKHNRRVLSIKSVPGFLHRTGDQSPCNSTSASMFDSQSNSTKTFAKSINTHSPNYGDLQQISTVVHSRKA